MYIRKGYFNALTCLSTTQNPSSPLLIEIMGGGEYFFPISSLNNSSVSQKKRIILTNCFIFCF